MLNEAEGMRWIFSQRLDAREPSDGAPAKRALQLRIHDGMLLGAMLIDERLRKAWANRRFN